MRTLLFDLDGTLADPRDGVTGCIRYALERLGEPPADELALLGCVGPPLWESFGWLLREPTPERIAAAIAAYRERYTTTGILENRLYPGIVDCLRALSGRGLGMVVVTSKPRPFALRVTDRLGITALFREVHGPGLDDESSTKGDLIARVLACERIRPLDAVMIGDRKHDVLGARLNGVPSIGVGWGFGSRAELVAAGADAIVERPEDLTTCDLLADF